MPRHISQPFFFEKRKSLTPVAVTSDCLVCARARRGRNCLIFGGLSLLFHVRNSKSEARCHGKESVGYIYGGGENESIEVGNERERLREVASRRGYCERKKMVGTTSKFQSQYSAPFLLRSSGRYGPNVRIR